ncbi:hypothetical protein FM109_09960 [Vibrio casei]|nr:hypothetical protein FM109_09960 [Vibrio casei]
MELGCFGLKFHVFGKFNWKRHLLWRYASALCIVQSSN